MVCLLDTGDIEFMFTGDAEEPVEARFMALSNNIDAEILKVGHHGSNSSTTEMFLDRVNPEVAVISVGADNRYGHPAPATVQRIKDAGAKIYRTDLNGNIVVKTDGHTYKVLNQSASFTPKPVVQPAPVKPQPEPQPEPSVSTGKYVGSENSDKYHYPNCRYAEKIYAENEIWFKDAADARAHGYVPCGVCKP